MYVKNIYGKTCLSLWLLTGCASLRTAALPIAKPTPLFACKTHDDVVKAIKQLRDRGDRDMPPVCVAAKYGDADMVQFYLNNDDDDEQSFTRALTLSAHYGHPSVVDVLCGHAVKNASRFFGMRNRALRNMHPQLGIASCNGDQKVVEVFLKYNVPLYRQDLAHDSRLFHGAALKGHSPMIKLLLDHESALLKPSLAGRRIANAAKQLKDYLPDTLIAEVADYMGLGQAKKIPWYQLHKKIGKPKTEEALFIPSLQARDGLGRTPLESIHHALKSEKDQVKRQKLEKCVALFKAHPVNIVNSLIKSDSKLSK